MFRVLLSIALIACVCGRARADSWSAGVNLFPVSIHYLERNYGGGAAEVKQAQKTESFNMMQAEVLYTLSRPLGHDFYLTFTSGVGLPVTGGEVNDTHIPVLEKIVNTDSSVDPNSRHKADSIEWSAFTVPVLLGTVLDLPGKSVGFSLGVQVGSILAWANVTDTNVFWAYSSGAWVKTQKVVTYYSGMVGVLALYVNPGVSFALGKRDSLDIIARIGLLSGAMTNESSEDTVENPLPDQLKSVKKGAEVGGGLTAGVAVAWRRNF